MVNANESITELLGAMAFDKSKIRKAVRGDLASQLKTFGENCIKLSTHIECASQADVDKLMSNLVGWVSDERHVSQTVRGIAFPKTREEALHKF